jgi:Eukaryotic aspartyl protease
MLHSDFDTGSSDTLVGPEAYNPSKSSTSKDTGTTFEDSYGDGTTASGEVYQDVLTIGGLKANTAYIGRSQSDFVDQGAGIAGMAVSVYL